jgi:hypothetical protein
MNKFGRHAPRWVAQWTRDSAELSLREAAKAGLGIVEVPLPIHRIDASTVKRGEIANTLQIAPKNYLVYGYNLR